MEGGRRHRAAYGTVYLSYCALLNTSHASSIFFDAQMKPREIARNSSKNSSGMKTQSPAIVRGSDQRTRIIRLVGLGGGLERGQAVLRRCRAHRRLRVHGPVVFVVVRRWSRVWLGRRRLAFGGRLADVRLASHQMTDGASMPAALA